MKDQKKEPKVYLLHILDAISELEIYAKDDWENKKTTRAIERCLEIIGEAANNLSKDFQKNFPEIEWELIVGMRHKIIHDYFDVDGDVVQSTVHQDIPVLKNQIEAILNKLKN